jgi:RND family efflux transporter MFP subunit
MTRKRMLAILATVAVAAGLLGLRHARVVEMERAPVLSQPATAVQVVAVQQGTLESADHILGEVYGADDADIAPQVSGQVLEVLVREGDHVPAGAVLARLDPRELDDLVAEGAADVDAARAASAAQIAATARDSVLFVNKAISQEQWEGSQAMRAAATGRLDMARHRLDQARVRLGYAMVRAPFPGVISARLADPGALAMPGKPLLRMVRQTAVRVRGAVPPELATRLHPGIPVDLTLGGQRLEATVSRVFPAMEGSHLVTFEIDVARATPGYVAGATVGVDLHLRSAAGLLVPLDALLESEAGTHAFVVSQSQDGRQTLRVASVSVVARSIDDAAVTGDLHKGDLVVVARPSRLMDLSDGMPVRPANPTAGR